MLGLVSLAQGIKLDGGNEEKVKQGGARQNGLGCLPMPYLPEYDNTNLYQDYVCCRSELNHNGCCSLPKE